MSTDIQQTEETDMTHNNYPVRRGVRTRWVYLLLLTAATAVAAAGYLLGQTLAG